MPIVILILLRGVMRYLATHVIPICHKYSSGQRCHISALVHTEQALTTVAPTECNPVQGGWWVDFQVRVLVVFFPPFFLVRLRLSSTRVESCLVENCSGNALNVGPSVFFLFKRDATERNTSKATTRTMAESSNKKSTSWDSIVVPGSPSWPQRTLWLHKSLNAMRVCLIKPLSFPLRCDADMNSKTVPSLNKFVARKQTTR